VYIITCNVVCARARLLGLKWSLTDDHRQTCQPAGTDNLEILKKGAQKPGDHRFVRKRIGADLVRSGEQLDYFDYLVTYLYYILLLYRL